MVYPIEFPERPEGQSATRRETEQQQAEAEALLSRLLETVTEYEGRSDRGYFEIEPDSTLYIDDAFAHPLKASAAARMAVVAAIDHLRTLRLLVERGDIPLLAIFTLLRSAIETASVAIWLLESDDRDTRLLRLLQGAWQEVRDASNMMASFGTDVMDPPREAREEHILRAHARRPRIGPESSFRSQPSITKKIERAQAIVSSTIERNRLSSVVLGLWQGFSGITHGRSYAMQTILDREELAYDPATGVVDVHLTTGARSIVGSLSVTLDVVETALRLYGRRARAWTCQPEDVDDWEALRAGARARSTIAEET